MIRLLAWSVMRTWVFGSHVHCTGVLKQVGTRAGLSELAILPDDVAEGVHQNHAVVRDAVGGLRDHPCGRAGAGHQGERPDPLGVVDADDGPR